MNFFHGTDYKSYKKILSQGVSLSVPRKKDTGDLGWGFYLTTELSRAKVAGQYIVQLDVDVSEMAYIVDPYFLKGLDEINPVTPAEQLFYNIVFQNGNMLTVNGNRKDKEKISKLVRQKFLEDKYSGIRTDYNGNETVVFNLNILSKPQLVK